MLCAAGAIDLNTMAEKLCVQKRRVYDMTCVLEGIGLLVKIQKNVVKWMPPPELEHAQEPAAASQDDAVVGEPAVKHDDDDDDDADEDGGEESRQQKKEQEIKAEQLRQEVILLAKAEKQYDALIRSESERLQKLAQDRWAGVSLHDLYLTNDEPTLLVVQAPPGTELRVPDPYLPSAARKFELRMTSTTGRIVVRVLRRAPSTPVSSPPQPAPSSADSAPQATATAAVPAAAAAVQDGGVQR